VKIKGEFGIRMMLRCLSLLWFELF